MIKKIIQKDLAPFHIEELGINVLAAMEEFKTCHFPIVTGQNKLLGLIHENHVLNMENLENSLNFIKHKINNIFGFIDGHLFESLRLMTEHKVSLLPIINSEHYYIGYLTPFNIINEIAQIEHDYSNTTIIVITTQSKNYILSEISRLIEENNGKIITLWHQTLAEEINLHLLVKCEVPERIIQTLERYDYNICNIFTHNSKKDNLNDRFESFIKYLNP